MQWRMHDLARARRWDLPMGLSGRVSTVLMPPYFTWHNSNNNRYINYLPLFLTDWLIIALQWISPSQPGEAVPLRQVRAGGGMPRGRLRHVPAARPTRLTV